ncbi:MAG: class I SAM-dependent methyltransferase [Actinomycetota bacterium]|nr:class I SAM-dependent methyltransferase [Actinomycetota bacterium]
MTPLPASEPTAASPTAAFDAARYGEAIADDYDELMSDLDPGPAVDTIADLADGGPVVEFGIGTGRIALPLRERGLAVAGIEGSPQMAARLRAKPGGEHVEVVVGDFTDTRVPGEFRLAVLTYNTIFALPSQDAQVRTFRNAARHLRPGGAFVVEAWIPDVGNFRNGLGVRPYSFSDRRVVLEAAEIHPSTQHMRTTKVYADSRGTRVYPANHRYAWPAELDLMARLAGLRLEQRWAAWDRSPFLDTSTTHVSVWRRTEDGPW